MATQDDPEQEPEHPEQEREPEREAAPAQPEASGASNDVMSQHLATRIEHDVESPLPWRSILKKTITVVVAGITIYLVFPSLTEVFASWPKLTSLDPVWFSLAVLLEIAHFTCTISLQRLALGTKAWFSVATSQLAGNAISLVVPGGSALGAATQIRMLTMAGQDTTTAVSGLTAFSLLEVGGLLALPIFVLPAIIAGTPIANGLEHAALLGIVAFVLFAGFSAIVLGTDRPVRWAGSVVQAVRNRIRRKEEPMTGLPDRLVYERNRIRGVLGQKWKQAVLLSTGRLAFDFGCLLATLKATGAEPNPSLVLVAYAVAGLLALLPFTPGGLGIVEAGLSALLILAGIPSGDAVVATLAYRIISYWLPMFVGPFAYLAFRRRYGPPGVSGGPALATG